MINDIGQAINNLYGMRESRLMIERQVKAMKADELAMRNEIFEWLAANNLKKASGTVATASIQVSAVPLVEDWDTFHIHIQQTGEFDLLQKRISVTAWRARSEDGIIVPGVSKVEDVDISLTKASR
jgi:hypothetical protein